VAELEPIWVAEPAAFQAMLDHLAESPRVALDTEFHGERSYLPHLMLLQLATERRLFLVDPLAGLDVGAVFRQLAERQTLVVGHALQGDLEIVALGHEVVFPRLWDTQIGAAFLGSGLQIGLGNLLHDALGVRLSKGAQMADWSRRPLPERQLAYAADDVRYLLDLHTRQTERLRELGRLAWAEQECAPLSQRARYGRDPMQCWQRVSGAGRLRPREAGVLVELAAERDRVAAEVNAVPHFLLSDDLLVELARLAPLDREALGASRRLQQRNVQRYAERWLAACARGLERPFVVPNARGTLPPGAEAVAALVMLLVTEIAGREGIAVQLLLRRKTLLEALQRGCVDLDATRQRLGLEGWRAELIGEPLERLLRGTLQVRVRCGEPDELGIDFDAAAPATPRPGC
jgi:ribonuclease D